MSSTRPQSSPHHADGDGVTEFSLTVLVALELAAIFIVSPLNEMNSWPVFLDFILMSSIVLAAVIVVWRNRAAVITIILSFAAGISGAALRHDVHSSTTLYLDFAAKIAFLGALTWVVGIAVFGPGRVTFHRIQGAIAMYLQISLIFTYFYLLLAQLTPGAFSPAIALSGPTGDVMRGARGGATLLHFSLTTLTTVGYGDIVPVHPIARSLANLEALIGQLFPAIILARVVTLELEGRRKS